MRAVMKMLIRTPYSKKYPGDIHCTVEKSTYFIGIIAKMEPPTGRKVLSYDKQVMCGQHQIKL